MQYRHEIKYRINRFDMKILETRLGSVLHSDPNCKDGKYSIRSLYFDTFNDEALIDNLSGNAIRNKYRIRLYNGDLSYIVLEKKCKDKGLGFKLQTKLTLDEVQRIIDHDYEFLNESEDSLKIDLYNQIVLKGLSPKSIVVYDRKPYIFNAGNTRVTLDYNIKVSKDIKSFLNKDFPTVSPLNDSCILEVKWDNYLPDIVKDVIQIPGRTPSAYSKYVASRMYD